MPGISRPFIFIPLSLALFFVGFFTGKHTPSKETTSPFTETRNQGNYQFINPLLECDIANFAPGNNLDRLRNQVGDFINSKINSHDINFASVYYRDLNNGPWFGINEKTDFSPASLIKVPLMITYYKAAEADPTLLQQKLTVSTPYDYSNQNVTPVITLNPSQEYTVDELINRTIIYSDNQAYELLLRNIDVNKLAATYLDLGVDVDLQSNDPTGNILSVKSYASFFRILFNSSYLSRTMSEKALELLSKINYRDGLVASVPATITVSHKFGERSYDATGEKQLHDCGIVYLPGKPYLVCIMTRGKDFSRLTSTIKSISNTIYTHLASN